MRVLRAATRTALVLLAATTFAGVVRPATASPVRSVQVLVLPGEPGDEELFRKLAAQGVERVYLRAFQLAGDRRHGDPAGRIPSAKRGTGVYFPSRHLPVVEDRLVADCRAARRAGLSCHAWMTTRKSPVPALLAGGERHLSWQADPISGEPKVMPGVLDLFDPEVARVLTEVFVDLARTGVDGVLLQDDFTFRQGEGFSPAGRRAAARALGRPLTVEGVLERQWHGERWRLRPSAGFRDWAHVKRDRLLELAGRFRAAARQERPGFELSLNLYYETALLPEAALAWMAQDLESAAAADVDRLAVMAYHRQVAEERSLDTLRLGAELQQMADRLRALPPGSAEVLVKVQTKDWSTGEPIPVDELRSVATIFAGMPLALVPCDDVGACGPLLQGLRR